MLRAGGLEQAVELRVGRVLRAHEHQVLEEVREARASDLLVARPHVVPDVRGHRGDGAVLVDDEREAVGEGVHDDGHPERGALGDGGSGQCAPARARAASRGVGRRMDRRVGEGAGRAKVMGEGMESDPAWEVRAPFGGLRRRLDPDAR